MNLTRLGGGEPPRLDEDERDALIERVTRLKPADACLILLAPVDVWNGWIERVIGRPICGLDHHRIRELLREQARHG